MKFLNSFNENISLSDKEYLLSQSYINEYSTEKYNGELNIPIIYAKSYVNDLFKRERVVLLTYSSLFRFLLFAWIYKYNGYNDKIIDLINQLNKKDDYVCRIFGQMSKNNKLIKTISNIIKTDDIYTKDYKKLVLLLKNKDIIFTEENIINWYNLIDKITKNSNKIEDLIIRVINTASIINLKNATKAKASEDILGVDIVAYTYRNERKTIQVKKISKESELLHYWRKSKLYRDSSGNFKTTKKQYIINIKNTTLDLKDYNKWEDGYLPYDFLYLYYDGELLSINSKSIKTIKKDSKRNTIYITLDVNKEWFDKMVKNYLINEKRI